MNRGLVASARKKLLRRGDPLHRSKPIPSELDSPTAARITGKYRRPETGMCPVGR